MKEATDIMGKMKEMGGGDQFTDLMKNLTKGMGKGMKFNKGAFQSMQKEFEMKERLREKVKQKKAAQILKTGENKSVFKIDSEEQKRSEAKREELIQQMLAEEDEIKQKVEKKTTKTTKKKKKKKN